MSTDQDWQLHSHRDVSGGSARAAVFGVSDGLVSNVALILGVAGADSKPGQVLVAGIAGLVAGAVSMAAGEYVSVQAQNELFERELSVERSALANRPAAELAELTSLYVMRGVDEETARSVAEKLMADPEVALAVHAREELGIAPEAVASPYVAAGSSFAAFAVGALVPLVPWLLSSGTAATIASMALGVVAAAVVGALLARFTERSIWRTSARQVLLILGSCAVTFAIGKLVGTAVG